MTVYARISVRNPIPFAWDGLPPHPDEMVKSSVGANPQCLSPVSEGLSGNDKNLLEAGVC